MELYMSKAPMKYTSMPLNLVLELVFKTNTKLNLVRQGIQLVDENDHKLPEYHTVRFEGVIGKYDNSVDGILQMRNQYKKYR